MMKDSIILFFNSQDSIKATPVGYYHHSYPVIIRTIQQSELNEDLLLTCHCFVYSWMPKIPLNFNGFKSSGNYLKSLQNHRTDATNEISKEQLSFLLDDLNNSIPAFSKFLHFLFPESYAIYDGNIRKILHGSSNWPSKPAKRLEEFIEYQAAMKEVLEVKRKSNPKLTLRELENQLFLLGRNSSDKPYDE